MLKKIAALFSLCLLLTGCGDRRDAIVVGELFEGEVNTQPGVSMTLNKAPSPTTISCTILNDSDGEVDTGNAGSFALQVEQEGDWYWLECESWATTSEAIGIPKGEPVQMDFSWSEHYGRLLAGHYRLVKSFSIWTVPIPEPEDYQDFLLTVEFTLD